MKESSLEKSKSSGRVEVQRCISHWLGCWLSKEKVFLEESLVVALPVWECKVMLLPLGHAVDLE